MTINSRSPENVNLIQRMIDNRVSFTLKDGTRLENLGFVNNQLYHDGQKSMNSFLKERTGHPSCRWLDHVYFDSGGKKILLKTILTSL